MSLQINNSVSLLYPKFYLTLHKALEEARGMGMDAYIFETYRSAERQDQLYSLGRTAEGKIVTSAKGYMSWHQYGMAADLAFGGPGKWTWDGPFKQLAELLQARGLRWLGMKDAGHFEYNHPLSIFEAKQIALKKGMLSVWLNIENILKEGDKTSGITNGR